MRSLHCSHLFLARLLAFIQVASAEVDNLKVVTDASPDYSDMESLVHSMTGKWTTPEEKCWAVFYWNHIARRQTNPIMLHGFALTDPIRQFNDYGYTMCSTISGINCSIWDAMGLKPKYWDISNHTVAEVEYNGGWHMYDNSLSASYTLCDGKTLAGVVDIGRTLGCEASGGKLEPGHIAKYHCLHATSPNGFLTGSDTARSLEEEFRCFNPNGLKYRSYYFDWDRGHRYILNLREGETYTRYYASLGESTEYYIPNTSGKDAEQKGKFKQRGNGLRTFTPALTPDRIAKVAHSLSNVRAVAGGGVEPLALSKDGELIFKVEGANVITSLQIDADFFRKGEGDVNELAISTSNGLNWLDLWKSEAPGDSTQSLKLVSEVNGSYEVLVRVRLRAQSVTADALLKRIAFTTLTQLNAKTQPQLNLGTNTVYIGAGDQSESIVYWPELPGGKAAPYIVEQQNVAFKKENPGYMGTLHAEKQNADAWVVFRMDTPRDITRIHYGGRLYNRAPRSHIDFLHSFDGGVTWTKSYSLTDTKQPWDVIHYETVDQIPSGTRTVLFKYLLNGSEAGSGSCSIYAVRMEANQKPADPQQQPVEATFRRKEVQEDRSTIEKSHTAVFAKLPARYTINVGGTDHPIMSSLSLSTGKSQDSRREDISTKQETGAGKFVPQWLTTGKNLAIGKSYIVSAPSETQWEAGDPEGTKLTDGIGGPNFAGGTSYRFGALWSPKKNPIITVDLGKATRCAGFGMNFHGYPWHDAMKGQIKDTVEVLVSNDGSNFQSVGFLKTDLRRKDIPVNFMLPDNEQLTGGTFRLIPAQPVEARFVRYKITNARVFDVTELEVLDSIELRPHDLRIALPDEKPALTSRR